MIVREHNQLDRPAFLDNLLHNDTTTSHAGHAEHLLAKSTQLQSEARWSQKLQSNPENCLLSFPRPHPGGPKAA